MVLENLPQPIEKCIVLARATLLSEGFATLGQDPPFAEHK